MSGFDFRNMSSTNAVSAMDSTNIAAQAGGVPSPYTAAPIQDFSTPVTLSPGGNYLPANTPQGNISAMDQQIGIAGQQAMRQQQNPNQFNALMYAGQLLNQGQPQRQSTPSFGQIKPAQQPNITDPVGALLAPKMKKKQPISLL